jgi:prevent-host-death family protein
MRLELFTGDLKNADLQRVSGNAVLIPRQKGCNASASPVVKPCRLRRDFSHERNSDPVTAFGLRRRGYWILQDAKARFSELVRKVRSEGPQHVTVHGRDEVVIIAAEEFRRLTGSVSGEALIKAMQASPYRKVNIEPKRDPMPVRDLSL